MIVPDLQSLPWPARLPRPTWTFITFGAIGLGCTIAYVAVYNLLREWLAPLEANGFALGLTMLANFVGHRWVTFRRAQGRLGRDLAWYLAVYAVGIAASSLVLSVLLRFGPDGSRVYESGAGLASGVAATIIRYLALQRLFRPVGEPAAIATRSARATNG
jgi:putative flippase GtrA